MKDEIAYRNTLEKIQKKRMRVFSNYASLLMIFIVGATFLLPMLIYPFLMTEEEMNTAGIVINVVIEVLALLIAARLTNLHIKEFFHKPQTGVKVNIISVFAVVGAATVGVYIFYMILILCESVGVGIYIPEVSAEGMTGPSQVFAVLYFVLLAPILEELIFRGFILRSLMRFGKIAAIVFSALLFALFHANIAQFSTAFLCGLVLAFITIKSGSLWPAVIAHIVNNGLNELIYSTALAENSAAIIADNVISIVGFVCFTIIISLMFLQAPRWRTCQIKPYGAKAFATMVFTPAFLVYLAICIAYTAVFGFYF